MSNEVQMVALTKAVEDLEQRFVSLCNCVTNMLTLLKDDGQRFDQLERRLIELEQKIGDMQAPCEAIVNGHGADN